MSVNHMIVSLLSIIALLSGSACSLSCYTCDGYNPPCDVVTVNTPTSTCDPGNNLCQTISAFGLFSRSCTNDTTAGCNSVGTDVYCTFACTTDLCNTDVPPTFPPDTTASTRSAAPAANARAVLRTLAAALLVLWALSRADMK